MSFRSAVRRVIEEIPEDPDPVPIPQDLPSCVSTSESPRKQLTFKSLQNERDNFRQLTLKSRERDFSSETLNKLRNFEHEWNSSRDLFRLKSDTSPILKTRTLSSERTKIDSSKLLIEIANATSAALKKVKQFEERKEEPIDDVDEGDVRILDIRTVKNKKSLEKSKPIQRHGTKSFDYKIKPTSSTSKSSLHSSDSITPYEFFLNKFTEEDSSKETQNPEEKTEVILRNNLEGKRAQKRTVSDKEGFGPKTRLGMHTPRVQATPVELGPSSPMDSELENIGNISSKTPEIEDRTAKTAKIKITTNLYKKPIKNHITPVLKSSMVESPKLCGKTTSPIKQPKSPLKPEATGPSKRNPIIASPKSTRSKTLFPIIMKEFSETKLPKETKEPEKPKGKQKVSLQISKEFVLSIESTPVPTKEEVKSVPRENSKSPYKPTRDSRRSPNLVTRKDKRSKKRELAELNPSPIDLSGSKDVICSTKELNEIKELPSKEDLLKKMSNLKAYNSKTPRTCAADMFNDSGTEEKAVKTRKLNRRQQEDLISRLVGNSARRRLFLYK
jgi:hypothetical protein